MSAVDDTGQAAGPPPGADGDAILSTTGITKVFGGLVAVEDVTFEIPRGRIVSIIGPNGAGKTTFFNMLTGLYKPTFGRVEFDGRNITGRRPDRIMALGVAQNVPEHPPVRDDERARERDGRPARPHEGRPVRLDPALPARAQGGESA